MNVLRSRTLLMMSCLFLGTCQLICMAAHVLFAYCSSRRHIHRAPTENYTERLPFGFVTRLHYADKRIVNIMKV